MGEITILKLNGNSTFSPGAYCTHQGVVACVCPVSSLAPVYKGAHFKKVRCENWLGVGISVNDLVLRPILQQCRCTSNASTNRSGHRSPATSRRANSSRPRRTKCLIIKSACALYSSHEHIFSQHFQLDEILLRPPEVRMSRHASWHAHLR